MTTYIASDHAGFTLKQELLVACPPLIDLGTNSSESVDYPDFAQKMAQQLEKDPQAKGILICGTGMGICMAANRFKHIRAANCGSVQMALLAREHNDANVLCLPGRFLSLSEASPIVDVFLKTPFSGETQHQNRIRKLEVL